jgi:hypothetical protein
MWQRVDLPRELDGNLPVNLQDQHSEMIVVPLHIVIQSGPLLALATIVDATNITLTGGHSCTGGHSICIKEGTHFYIGIVLSVTTNVLNLDTPLDYAFTTAAEVCIGNPNLSVNGSITPKIAHLSPPFGVQWDITRLHVRMIDVQVMDAGTFGGRAALPNGVVLRRSDGSGKNIANVKSNGDLAMMASGYSFDAKPPSGHYGFTSYHVFGGQEHVGVTLRLDGSDNDEIQAIIQDDLTGIDVVKIVAIGHVVTY